MKITPLSWIAIPIGILKSPGADPSLPQALTKVAATLGKSEPSEGLTTEVPIKISPATMDQRQFIACQFLPYLLGSKRHRHWYRASEKVEADR